MDAYWAAIRLVTVQPTITTLAGDGMEAVKLQFLPRLARASGDRSESLEFVRHPCTTSTGCTL